MNIKIGVSERPEATALAEIALQFTRSADVIMNDTLQVLLPFKRKEKVVVMAQRNYSSLALISLLLCGISMPAQALVNYPTTAYDATYVRRTEQGVSDYRYCTDGEGHVRIETTPPTAGYTISDDKPANSVTIFDYPHKVMFTLLEKQKIAIKAPLNGNANGAPLNPARIKEMNGKDLGIDTKFNHPCHGYQWEENGVTTEQWIATDLKCPLHTETMSAKGNETMHLAKYKLVDANPADFEIPADFKITDVNNQATTR